ncbi:MAG: hypothetical protein KDB31_14880 [Microthrixaceae bacterium]|nr:hypothetical protein [Microthrixaceae bacterium]
MTAGLATVSRGHSSAQVGYATGICGDHWITNLHLRRSSFASAVLSPDA